MTHLTTHFSLAEFVASSTAARRGIDNTLPAGLIDAARQTCEVLESIRDHLSDLAGRPVPVLITSGYRAPAVNQAVGGKPTSDHLRALAVDFTAPAFGSPHKVAQALQPHIDALGIGQLIHEFGAWVHVSTRRPDRAVNRVLTINTAGTVPGIKEA